MLNTIDRPTYMSFLHRFRDCRDRVKIITGVRGCGKTTLLFQFIEKLQADGVRLDEILYTNLESALFDGIRNHRDLSTHLKDSMPEEGRIYIFLEGIQRITDWEKSVCELLEDTEADLYITSSDLHLLSGKSASCLAGRHIGIEMLPLSFREYVDLNGNDRDTGVVFEEYIKIGGFPSVRSGSGEHTVSVTLEDLYSSIVFRDIVCRRDIRKHAEIEGVIRYLMRNIGNTIDQTSISRELKIDPKTVGKYLEVVQEAGLFYRIYRMDVQTDKVTRITKFYVADTGLLNIDTEDIGKDRMIENIVYLELRRRGYEVMSGIQGSVAIDFVTTDGMTAYWQICPDSDDVNVSEELATLRAIGHDNPKTAILPNYDGGPVTVEGVRMIGLTDFLLNSE